MLTPTGAAILTTIAERFCPLPAMKIEAVGYGAGSRDPEEFPNALRLILGQTVAEDSGEVDTVCLVETNVDDISGELVGFLTEKLLKDGALDVFSTPIIMKHSRPAIQISVICKVEDAQRFQEVLFEQGITLGVRKQIVQRSKLRRELVTVETEFGPIRIKTGLLKGKVVCAKAEFGDCVSAGEKHNVPVRAVSEAALAAYKKGTSQTG
ncbi:MAG: nickel pincer cofactor biosynthesis protein LarC2 [Planctomycetota bacterium]